MSDELELLFYTRAGCHLCDVALREVRAVQQRIPFRLSVRDVDANPSWAARFGDEVPVGVIDGKKVFKYHVDARRLERALCARAR